MYGKIAVVLLSGVLAACVPTQPPAAPPAPPPPAPTAVPPPPPGAAAMPGPRIVDIRRATCEVLLQLPNEDRAAAVMFYIGYQASRSGSRTIDVNLIPSIEGQALSYCQAYPNRTVAQAFAQAYADARRR